MEGKVFNVENPVQIRVLVRIIVSTLFKMLSFFSVLSNQDTLEHIQSCFEVNLS